jgi:Uncharacterized conserved protein (DUF2190)
MARPGLTFSYTAEMALPARRFVKHGAADGRVTLATDGAVPILGAAEQIPTKIGFTVDVIHTECAVIEAGAAVARSSVVSSDATGRAIVAAPAAGVNMWAAGVALEAATAAGDLIRILLAPQRIQG